MKITKMGKSTKNILDSVKHVEQPKTIAKSVSDYAKAMKTPAEDTFENVAKQRERLASEIEGVQFVAKKIQYTPENLKKMETMTREEKREYMLKLRLQGKFTYVDE